MSLLLASPMLILPSVGGGGGSTITYVNKVTGSNAFSSGITLSFASNEIQNIANNAAVAVVLDGGQEPTAVSVTIGGVAATIVPNTQPFDASLDAEVSIWEASGSFTDDDVDITSEASAAAIDESAAFLFDIGTLTGQSTGGSAASATDNTSTATQATTCSSGDQLIAIYGRAASDAGATSFSSGATEVAAAEVIGGALTVNCGINTNAGANQSVVWNRTANFNHTAYAVGVFA